MARVTLQDVATTAGVSLATASKVMNSREDVKASTRERVSTVANDLGYRPRPRSTAEAPTRNAFVVTVFDRLSSPYALQILAGIQDAAARAGVDVVVKSASDPVSTTRARTLSSQWFQDTAAEGCAAVIAVTTPIEAKQAKWARRAGLPLIVIDPVTTESVLAGDDRLVRISATNWAGARTATDHLVQLSHRRIGIITGPLSSAPSRERVEGYRTALDSAHLAYLPELVKPSTYSFDGGREGAGRLLGLADPPTAIIACSDTIALGALRAAYEAHVRVPADLSIVSFDDTPLATWSTPQLTAIRQPLVAMGQVAVERGLALAADPDSFAHPFQLETGLVIRESTAPPAGIA